MALTNNILRKVVPIPAQRIKVDRAVEELLAKVRSNAKRIPFPVEVKVVGSVAKDTYLFPPDLDIFVLFPTDVPRSDLEKYGLDLGRRVLGGEERYAEHPYIHGMSQGFDVDIVPCYAVLDPSKLKSAVDRTPFHTDYVLKRLRKEQHDQVRLLKQFMKGIGTYSAEAKIQGFSGYLVELLILKYGDFEGVLRSAQDWGEGLALSLGDSGNSKFTSPMTFYDPVDGSRNVASALSMQNMSTFIHASREYLKSPDVRFFFPKPRKDWSITRISNEMRKRGTKLIMVQLPKPDLTEDNLYPQVRKTLEGMTSTLCSAGFVVIDRSFSVRSKKVDLLMELQADRLPPAIRRLGPPVTSEPNSFKFIQKWKGTGLVPPFIENGRWVTLSERPHRTAKNLLEHEMHKAGLGKEMKGLGGMRVLSHGQVLKVGPRASITDLLDKTFPWDR